MNAKELFNLCHAQAHNVIDHIFGVLKQHFQILLLPSHYPLAFQSHIPVTLCALQNFIQEIDHDEGAILTDSYQSSYTPFSPDIYDDDSGFIAEDDGKANSDVKLCRINTANEMWESYLNYMADGEAGSSDDDLS